jgi:RNA polymerase sigma factor (sigma-70 family)
MSELAKDDWADLLRRLQSDLESRRGAERSESGLDDAAWEEAARRIRHFARMLLMTRPDTSPDEVEDVVQNVLVKLQSVQTIKRVRSATSAKGYVWVIVRNAVLDLVRRRRQELESFERFRFEDLAGEKGVIPEEADQRATRLEEELRLLSPQERSLIKMRFWRSLTIGEIAAELGISYSAAAVRLFRLLRRLRERL